VLQLAGYLVQTADFTLVPALVASPAARLLAPCSSKRLRITRPAPVERLARGWAGSPPPALTCAVNPSSRPTVLVVVEQSPR
jgi:hypothetical protein